MDDSHPYGEHLLEMPEGKSFDRKSSSYELGKLANILIAFANADGGSVAIGIKNREFEGINHLSNKKINDFLQVGNQLVVPALVVSEQFIDVTDADNKPNRVLLLSVAPGEGVIYSNKKDEVYLRIGDETHKVTYVERQRLEYDRNVREYESQIIEDALLIDLDEVVVEQYRALYSFTGDNLWDLLFPRGLAKRIRTAEGKEDYRLTVAGVLLLAKQPTTFLPGARIRFVRYEGNKALTGVDLNIVKQVRVDGPLIKMLEEIISVVESQLRTFMRLNIANGKFTEVPEYPKGAWMEGIVNAVVHRAYHYNGDDIRILMFDDHIDIHSPGGFPAVVTPDNIRWTHYSRNPFIARALTDFGWVREFGEGVDRMYADMGEFYLDDPIYRIDANSVDLILKNNIVVRSVRKNSAIEAILGKDWENLNLVEQTAVTLAFEHGKIRTGEISEASNTSNSTARRSLYHLIALGILEKVATSKNDPKQYYQLIAQR